MLSANANTLHVSPKGLISECVNRMYVQIRFVYRREYKDTASISQLSSLTYFSLEYR